MYLIILGAPDVNVNICLLHLVPIVNMIKCVTVTKRLTHCLRELTRRYRHVNTSRLSVSFENPAMSPLPVAQTIC